MKKLFLTIVFMFVCSMAHSAWTVDSLTYDNRKKITVSNTNVDSDLNSFPVYIGITDDTDIGGNTNTDGFDIRFTQSDGETLLKYERERHVVTTGSLDADYWVGSNVSSTGGTDIYIYYRSTDTADGADAANVWDANYRAVYHLNNSLLDSSGNGYTITNDGADWQTGVSIIGDGAYDFVTANTDSMVLNNNIGITARPYTLSALARMDDADSYESTIWIGDKDVVNYFSMLTLRGGDPGDEVRAFMHEYNAAPATSVNTTSGYSATTWFHHAGTFDTGSGNVKAYIDGGSVGTGTHSATVYNHDRIGFGAILDFTPGGYMDGYLDEVRYSDSIRIAAWLKFEYNNMLVAGNELTFGNEESDVAAAGQIIMIIM